MAAVETITIGSDVFSVYGLGNADPVADADTYFAATFGETWSALSTLEKQQAIISAHRLMDRAILWSGTKTVAAQPCQWPRDGATNGCTSEAVTDGTTPDDIAYGEFELAMAIAADSTLLSSSGTGTNTKRVKAGSAEVEFFQPTAGTNDETRLPQNVHDLVACFQDGQNILPSSGTLSSGTGDSTSFDGDADGTGPDWNPSRGYS
jgi:hypothetical protein